MNKALFPNDTVQCACPEPGWLERWLDTQIPFRRRVGKESRRPHPCRSCSKLLDRSFESVKDLNRYRKEIMSLMERAATRRCERGAGRRARGMSSLVPG